jgi:hypothetical protein
MSALWGGYESREDMRGGPERAEYEDQRHHGFDRSMRKLYPDAEDDVIPELQRFMADWRQGLSAKELNQKWDYKSIKDKVARKWRVQQIKILRRKYRVELTPIDMGTPCVWFLEVFKKESKNRVEIRRAIERAKEIWKEEQ